MTAPAVVELVGAATSRVEIAGEGSDVAVVEIHGPEAGYIVDTTGPGYQIVEIGGAPGPPGPAGATGTAHTHIQLTPATVWTITHNLGYDPAGILVVSDGYVLDEVGVPILTPGEVMRLSFDISVAGVAHLS